MTFSDVAKQNNHASAGTLYREPLVVVVVRYDTSGCIIEKGPSRGMCNKL